MRYLIIFSLLATSALASPEFLSFEEEQPSEVTAESGKLSVTTAHLQDGKQSLCWEFQDGDALVFHTGPLGDVNRRVGYGGYSRSALILPLYLTELSDGHLLVEVRAGDETAATITVPFAHVGWQKLAYHYTWKSRMNWSNIKLRGKIDNLRISAHGLDKATSAYFDAIQPHTTIDFRRANDAITAPWKPFQPDFSQLPDPSEEDLAKLDKLTALCVPQPNPKTSRAHWEKRLASHDELIHSSGWKKGHPLTVDIRKCFGLLNTIANDWNICADPELKPQLAARFHTVNDWLQEQGLVVNGAFGRYTNYHGRTYVDAVTKMRDPLAQHGTLEASINYIKWSYSYSGSFRAKNFTQSMDYFHNNAFRMLRIALSHADPVERWHHVNIYRDVLGKQILASIKPDGSIFHHGFHYFAYGSMGMNDVSDLLAIFSAADLPVAETAIDKVRLAVMQMRWYSGSTTLWSLSGRSASGKLRVPTGAFLSLAKAYAPYRDGKWDPEMVAAYLRFNPNAAEQPMFGGYQPEPSPTGFNVMPYANLAMHRRDDWLAGVKGFSKYAASGESYAGDNRYGLWMSMGQLELLSHPTPLVTVHGSGTRPDEGYNWCAIEGTTTIHTPLENIANGNGTRHPRQPCTFVGGLGNGRNGVFTMPLDFDTKNIMPKGASAPAPLQALKSWFFFDDRIVCLGSNISTQNGSFPVRTNLFQKFLTDAFTTTVANGEKLTLAATTTVRDFSDGATMVDPYGNAYFVNRENSVHLEISEQKSRDSNDKEDTAGNYATAWIEHGIDPQNSTYQYSILVQPDEEALESFDPDSAFSVLLQDDKAHVVHDNATHTTAYVIFDKDASLPENTPLLKVNQACLVMIEELGDHLKVSVTNPDLKAGNAEPIQLTLDGSFTSEGQLVSDKDGNTQLTIPIIAAEPQTLRLDRNAP